MQSFLDHYLNLIFFIIKSINYIIIKGFNSLFNYFKQEVNSITYFTKFSFNKNFIATS